MDVIQKWQQQQQQQQQAPRDRGQDRSISQERQPLQPLDTNRGMGGNRGRSSSPTPWGFKQDGGSDKWSDQGIPCEAGQSSENSGNQPKKTPKKKKAGKGAGTVVGDISNLLQADKSEEAMLDDLRGIIRRAEGRGRGVHTSKDREEGATPPRLLVHEGPAIRA
eukprot:6796572-Alexandrium_andersonii.AAC.1